MVRDIIRERSAEVSVVWISGYRFLVATLVLAGVACMRYPPREVFLAYLRRDLWKIMIPMSFLGPFLGTILWTAGFKHTTAGRAGIYNQLSTVFIIALAVIILKERMNARKAMGVGLAVVGAIVVALQK